MSRRLRRCASITSIRGIILSSVKPEGIKKYSYRLNKHEDCFLCIGITITNGEKFRNYLQQIYCSGHFSKSFIRRWKYKAAMDQTYTNTITFFEEEDKGDREIGRLMGDTANVDQYGFIQVALKNGLDTIVDKFNANVQAQIKPRYRRRWPRRARPPPPRNKPTRVKPPTIRLKTK